MKVKAFKPLPVAECINEKQSPPENIVDIPEKKNSSIIGWLYILLFAAMVIGLAAEIKYVFGGCLSALLILASTSKELSRKTALGKVPATFKERLLIFIAGLVTAAFTFLAHAEGKTASLISTYLIFGILMLMPVYVLLTLVLGGISEIRMINFRKNNCTEQVSVVYNGMTLRGTGLPPVIDPKYGGNHEYEYWYNGEGYRILISGDMPADNDLDISISPNDPKLYYNENIFKKRKKDAVSNILAGIIFPGIAIAVLAFVMVLSI